MHTARASEMNALNWGLYHTNHTLKTTVGHTPQLQHDGNCTITVGLMCCSITRRNVNAKACSRRRSTRSECSPDPSLEHPAIATG